MQVRKTRSLTFNPPTEAETRRIREGLGHFIPTQAITSLFADKHLIVGRGRRNEVFLVSSALWSLYQQIQPHRNPYFLGQFLGELSPTRFRPSLQVLPFLVRNCTDAVKVEVTLAGEQRFLYGQSLTEDHIAKDFLALKKGLGVLVVNERGEGLGYGSVKRVSARAVTITNQQDLGWYLRRGR
jgi:ribosome biogenesis protein Nip4